MFKQKPHYEQPDALVRCFLAEKVIATSAVSFGDTGSVTSEDFGLDDELIDF